MTDRIPSPKFTFAVVTDTHVNPASIKPVTPFPSGQLANKRAAYAAARIAELKPSFVVHVGDMVHPVPGQPTFAAAAATFFDIFSVIDAPMYCTPGNHDIGDKPMRWLPSRQISEDCFDIYGEAFGPDWQAFNHDGCGFIILNSSLFNTGLPEEAEQWAFLSASLSGPERKFVFMHYPPFIFDSGEAAHYDNIAEPARSRLLALLGEGNVEGAFSGHVHNIFMNRHGAADMHVLPATSFVRQDYQELFTVKPDDAEYGRNDLARFGFYLVDVFDDGHVVHWIQTFGATEPDASGIPQSPVLSVRKAPTALGVDLRHAWSQPKTMTPTGVVDEFARKHVRNDYLVMQLNLMGFRKLRVPFTDWFEPETARRIRDLVEFGHEFVFYAFGVPTPEQAISIAKMPVGACSLEIVLHPDDMETGVPALNRLRESLGVPIFLSRLQIPGRTVGEGQHYTRVHHGFQPDDADEAYAILETAAASHLDGVAIRFERADSLWPALENAARHAARTGRKALVQVRMAGAKAHINHDSDAEACSIAAQATIAAAAYAPDLDLYLDTLVDQDRGYMPRIGLLDRRYEPRAAGLAVKTLSAYFARHGAPSDLVAEEGLLRFTVGEKVMALVLDAPAAKLAADYSQIISLATGEISSRLQIADIRTDEDDFMPILLAR